MIDTWELPHFFERQTDSDSFCWHACVPSDLAELDGHFPGNPVVPGVAQVGWVLSALHIIIPNLSPDRVTVDRAKFKAPVRPQDLVVMIIKLNAGRFSASIVNREGNVFSQIQGKALERPA